MNFQEIEDKINNVIGQSKEKRADAAIHIFRQLKPLIRTENKDPEAIRLANRVFRELLDQEPPNWDSLKEGRTSEH